MTSGSLNERITRALAFMLRHQPEEFDLELDRYGWGDLEEVVYALQERVGADVDGEDVEEAIDGSDRKRYEVKDGKIRALYGHSFAIDPGEPTEPPDELYIGIGSRDAARADENGLRSGRRAFLHLARTEEDAREAGRRAAKEYCVVTVFAGEAYDEGVDFYDRGALFLADEIPVDFIEVGDVEDDGYERDHHRRSRGRRGNDGLHGGRGRGGRGRGRGRDDDRDEPRGRGRGGRREDREPREPREEPRDVIEPRPAQQADAPVGDDGGFGLGLDSKKASRNDGPRSDVPRESGPRERKSERPAAKKEPRRDPEPVQERAPEPSAGDAPSPGGFGAGLD
ncbi:MAG: RNA 2'-phosphotransferase [Planctomycetota bacterium]